MIDARTNYQPGYTLLELVISLGAATLLMAGLSSSLYIASRAFDGGAQSANRINASDVQALMLVDIGEAKSFSARTQDTVEFTVPDRDGDANDEVIKYNWSAGSQELFSSYNGSSPSVILEGVSDWQFKYSSRTLSSRVVGPSAYDSNEWGNRWLGRGGAVIYHAFSEAKLPSSGEQLDVPIPSGTVEGDLLIAAMATDGNTKNKVAALPGWNLITSEEHWNAVTLSVWWKNAESSEAANHRFRWDGSQQAYAWMMRFSGHDPVGPIDTFAVATTGSGYTYYPTSPTVTTSVNNAMIVRLGGFDDDDIAIDSTGLNGHNHITMDQSNSGSGTCSGGAAWLVQSEAGSSGSSTFDLYGMEQTVAVTLAIAPFVPD